MEYADDCICQVNTFRTTCVRAKVKVKLFTTQRCLYDFLCKHVLFVLKTLLKVNYTMNLYFAQLIAYCYKFVSPFCHFIQHLHILLFRTVLLMFNVLAIYDFPCVQ